MSEKKDRNFSDTRSCTDCRMAGSVRDMPVIVRALRRIKPEGTHKERSKKHQVSNRERYRSASILPFGVQAHADGRRDGVTEAFRSTPTLRSILISMVVVSW